MSIYVLDTDILSLFQMAHPEVVRRVLEKPIQELAVTVITIEEQLTGWYTQLRKTKKKSELAKAYQRLADNVATLVNFRILSFTEIAIDRRNDLKRQKLNIGAKDLCIAAIALEHNATLVTRNRADFEPNSRPQD